MIVMLSGKQGSGKTTTANALKDYWSSRGTAVWPYKFARPIYEMHDAVYIVANQYGIMQPDGGKDGDLLQVLGTEWGRNSKDSNIWIKCARNKIAEVTDHWDKLKIFYIVLIDDLRFTNEFDAFPDAFKIRLECSPEVRKQRATFWREKDNHESEISLDPYVSSGKFSLVVNTETATAAEVVEQITSHFQERLNTAFAPVEKATT